MATYEVSLDNLITKVARYDDMLSVLNDTFYNQNVIMYINDDYKRFDVMVSDIDIVTGKTNDTVQKFATFIEAFRYAMVVYTQRVKDSGN